MLSSEKYYVTLNKDAPPHLIMILHRSNYKVEHSSLTLGEWFACGTFLQIDHHCISLWIPDMKLAAEMTDASGSRVPQNTLHLRQKTGMHNKYNLIDFLS